MDERNTSTKPWTVVENDCIPKKIGCFLVNPVVFDGETGLIINLNIP